VVGDFAPADLEQNVLNFMGTLAPLPPAEVCVCVCVCVCVWVGACVRVAG